MISVLVARMRIFIGYGFRAERRRLLELAKPRALRERLAGLLKFAGAVCGVGVGGFYKP